MRDNYEGVRTRIVMGTKDFILFYPTLEEAAESQENEDENQDKLPFGFAAFTSLINDCHF